MLPFLNNLNDEVSLNHKYEVETMMSLVPKLSDKVTHYPSKRLCSNVQFSAIEKTIQPMKTDPSIIYMVPDHKKNVLQMRYREVQADYF